MNTNKELATGIEVEKEHGGDIALATKIATDHLREDPNYYSKLMAAGLGDEPRAQQIAQADRAVSGQEGNISLASALPAGQVITQSSPLKSSNLGKGGESLKSSGMKTNAGHNQVANGKTPQKTPEPTISSGEGLVNKTTGARLPNSVSITKTKPIGGEAENKVVAVSIASTESNPFERFLGKVEDELETGGQLHEGGSTLKKK